MPALGGGMQELGLPRGRAQAQPVPCKDLCPELAPTFSQEQLRPDPGARPNRKEAGKLAGLSSLQGQPGLHASPSSFPSSWGILATSLLGTLDSSVSAG